ncbi:LemA family protein [Sphingomonas sp. RP10(2022)]|uniref:LemA family protein n=1 Tax=Sphingomonas liriopis TaxID=2949094 RepID=A0A9X2KQJ4_9SPHN|nr:LemA family protein [Sphingomonas liriopis]MCP3734651.1 LemA family protein [Sphingomonas liriopis]
MTGLWIVAIALCVVLYLWYAAIVTRRNRVGEALGGIDAQLTQRHDLIPNMLAIAKRFMAHEHDLIAEITALRAQGAAAVGGSDPAGLSARFATEERLGADLRRLMAVAENYPALQSQAPMLEAQHALMETETNIAAARRSYNAAVTDLRNAAQIFPGPLLAALAGAGTMPPFYESTAEARAPVDAGALL